MTKKDYMDSLKAKLAGVEAELKEEIVNDYEEHFEMGAAEGKSEEQIISELGSIDELIKEIGVLDNEGSEAAKDSEQTEATSEEAKAENETKENAGSNGASGSKPFEFAGKTMDEYVNMFAKGLGAFGAAFLKGAEGFAASAETFAKNVSKSFDEARNAKMKEDGSESFDQEAEDADYQATDNAEKDQDDPEKWESTVNGTAKKVVISAGPADVKVIESKDGKINFRYINNGTAAQQLAYKFFHKQNGGTIEAEIKKVGDSTKFFRSIKSPKITLEVEIPAGFNNVYVKAFSGNIEADDINCAKFSADSMSGNIKASGVFEVYKSKTISGDINLDLNTTSEISLTSISGDIKLKEEQCKNICASTVSGDVDIAVANCDGYTAKITTVSGDTKMDFKGCGKSNVKNGNYIFGDGINKINVTTVSGDIDINA